MNITKNSLFGRKHRQIYIALAAIIALFVLGPRFGNPHQSEIENFILSSPELKKSIGAIERLELVETLKVYINEEIVHVEFVFLVAIIAVARKVIVLDIKNLEPLTLIGLASIILALSGGFYLLKKALGINQK